MIRIVLNENTLSREAQEEYSHWLEDARQATLRAIEEWESSGRNLPKEDYQQSIWARLKRWLAENLSHKKCAYCEVSLGRHQADAEHFRPKGAVRFRDDQGKANTARITMPDGSEVDHPGYFWLAYDPFNLLPACSGCNSCDWEGNVGKRAEFPVLGHYAVLVKLSDEEVRRLRQPPYPSTRWKGYYYMRPLDLNAEEDAALVNPMLDNPQQHLNFGLKGIITPLTERGRQTVRVFRLDLDDLARDRESQQDKLRRQVLGAWLEEHDPSRLYDRAKPALERFLDGSEPFAAAALDYVMGCLPLPLEFKTSLEHERRRRAGLIQEYASAAEARGYRVPPAPAADSARPVPPV